MTVFHGPPRAPDLLGGALGQATFCKTQGDRGQLGRSGGSTHDWAGSAGHLPPQSPPLPWPCRGSRGPEIRSSAGRHSAPGQAPLHLTLALPDPHSRAIPEAGSWQPSHGPACTPGLRGRGGWVWGSLLLAERGHPGAVLRDTAPASLQPRPGTTAAARSSGQGPHLHSCVSWASTVPGAHLAACPTTLPALGTPDMWGL